MFALATELSLLRTTMMSLHAYLVALVGINRLQM